MNIGPIQLGRFQAMAFDQGAEAWAILLPGANYSVQAPLLWYARRAALAAGRNVLAITDTRERGGDDPLAWVEERAEAALGHVREQDPHPVLVAKSLTSLAAHVAARQALPAVWLTPLIGEAGTEVSSVVLGGLGEARAPMLLVGGTADSAWNGSAASAIQNATVLELPDADHVLEVPDDVERSLDNLRQVTEAIERFLTELDQRST